MTSLWVLWPTHDTSMCCFQKALKPKFGGTRKQENPGSTMTSPPDNTSPWSTLLWSGVAVPAAPPPDVSLRGSLRFTLSLDPKRTWAPERELMSGEVSDSPGRSSALVGITVKRTDAMATGLEIEKEGGGGLLSRGREKVGGVKAWLLGAVLS